MAKHTVESKLTRQSCANPLGQADLLDFGLSNFGLKIASERKNTKRRKILLHLSTTKFVHTNMNDSLYKGRAQKLTGHNTLNEKQ